MAGIERYAWPIVQITQAAAGRTYDPLAEIGSDVVDVFAGTFKEMCVFFFGSQQDEESTSGYAAPLLSHTFCHQSGCSVALGEIAGDWGLTPAGTIVSPAYVASMLALLATPSPLASVLSLAGVALTTQMSCVVVGVVMTYGAISICKRHPEMTNRTIQRRSALIRVTAAACLGAILVFSNHPNAWVAAHVAQPEIAIHFMKELLLTPLIVLNLGYVAGRNFKEMLPTMCFVTTGAGGALGVAILTDPLWQVASLSVSAVSLFLAARHISQDLPRYAHSVSPVNKMRCRISADLLVYTWTLCAIWQGLGIIGSVTPSHQVLFFTMLDLLSKMGVSHILLYTRVAVQNADDFFADQEEQCATASVHINDRGAMTAEQ